MVQRVLQHLGLPTRSTRRGQSGRHPGHSKPRICPRALPNSTPPAEGAASREEGCRRAAPILFQVSLSLALLGLLDENRLQTAALPALSKGEGLGRKRDSNSTRRP
jgi:hypothetical protein